MAAIVLFPFFLLLGLFLPGYFWAKCLRHRLWWASAFVISLLVLFHGVFWLGILHVPLTLWTVAPCLAAVAGAGAFVQRRGKPLPDGRGSDKPWTTWERALLAGSAVVGAVLLARVAVSPLIGFDTGFRWDFLAQRIFLLGRFDYYPPLTPADFRTYFYPDAIPPMVSFTHWWLYASAGQYLPSLICIFVAAQFACTLAFTYGTAAALFSRRAGVLAVAILAASPLYFGAIVIGQETGLTALAIAAMLYFIVTATGPADARAMISAGLAAALCALSREYGWIALIIGGMVLLWRRHRLQQVLIFAGVVAAVAGPWYARTWILTGNPFYSLRFLGFPVNPVHVAFLEYYRQAAGMAQWPLTTWLGVAWHLLTLGALATFLGLPGAFLQLRRHGYLLVTVLILTAVWMQAAAYTSGGIDASTRVLSPAVVVLAIAAAALVARLRGGMERGTVALILLFQLWTAGYGVLYPARPFDMPAGEWAQNAFRRYGSSIEYNLRDQIASVLPRGSRILSDNAYLHAALIDKGIEVVPVWSPEMRFLFSASPDEAEQRLRALGIGSVALSTEGLNTQFLISAVPLYRALPQRWRPLAAFPNVLYIMVPPSS